MTDVILDLVADFVGPDIVSWGCHFFCKLAAIRSGSPGIRMRHSDR